MVRPPAIPAFSQREIPVREGNLLPPREIDEKMYRMWRDFGWTSGAAVRVRGAACGRDLTSLLLRTDGMKCVNFLRQSRLLYAIRGYQRTLDEARGALHDPEMRKLREGIQLDEDGHPLLLKEGQWVRWEEIEKLIVYDTESGEIVSRDNPDQLWSYTWPHGLCAKSRYRQIFPIYQLTPEEREGLQAHGARFFPKEMPEALRNQPANKRCYLQVFTSDNSILSRVSHVGIRLINQNGQVYSVGYETPPTEIPFAQQRMLGTYDAEITSLDYDEFRPFNQRRVTTIPLTEEQYQAAMGRIEEYNREPLRFNRLHQNCTTFVTDILQAAGHPVDTRCTGFGSLAHIFPRLRDIPYIGAPLHKIQQAVRTAFSWVATHCLPACIRRGMAQVAAVVSIVVNKIFSIITNLLGLCFGTTEGSPAEGASDDVDVDNRERLRYFDRLIKSPWDIFKNTPAEHCSPGKLIDWQLDTPSTAIYTYGGSPRLTIMPPAPSEA